MTQAANQKSPVAGDEQSLPKTYQPEAHEERIRERWLASGAFHADPARVLSGERKPYSVVIPPPNVTGALHLGHALNNTLQDILVRAHRMMGFEAMWMPGADHAGIATQTVVEKRLIEEGHPARIKWKREDFVAKVQDWKDEYEERIKGQLLAMGCSCDWDRWRFTMDEVCARAVREAFFRLFQDGLIYRGKRLVNWDPVTQTALADDEVEMEEVDGHFYYLRYPLVKKDGSELSVTLPGDETIKHVTVATTRPETYLGDTAVAVNPKDPRWEALQGAGAHVKLPFVGRVIPVIADDYVVMAAADPDAPGTDPKAKFATGFLKVTPAHDPNDWEIGQRHTLEAINVMAPDASISDQHGWSDVREAGQWLGMSREDARKAIVTAFKKDGLLEDVKPHRHSVGHSYRSHVPIEPYLSDQWYVKVTDDRLRGSAQRAVAKEQRTSDTHPPRPGEKGDDAMRFFPERYAKMYESWHDNIRDWCISRQLWWGHRIPVWSAPEGDAEAAATLKDILKRLDDRMDIHVRGGAKDDDAEQSGLHVCIRSDDDPVIPELESAGFVRDADVLDTWFSSALWPLSTMGWPDPDANEETKGLIDAFNPTSVLSTAREIITLWVSRMVMFNRYLTDDHRVPFHHVYIHMVVQDGEGKRMSKSAGNGVDPLDIIHSHGADAMRFTLCQMATQTQDVRMPVERDPESGRNTSPKFDIGKRFCNKLWNAARFTMMMLGEAEDEGSSGAPPSPPENIADYSLVDRWMLSRLAGAVKQAEAALADYQFAAYAENIYDLMWRDFCDWYLEAVKPTIKKDAGQQAVLRAALGSILRLLHPVCPFVTEAVAESFQPLARRGAPAPGVELGDFEMLCTAPWPVVDASLHSENVEARFERLRELVSMIRDVRERQQVPPRRRVTLHVEKALAQEIAEAGGMVETLAGLEKVETGGDPERASAFRFQGAECRLSGLVDEADAGAAQDAERERLQKRIEDLDKSISVMEKRLGNPGYVDKAPAQLVEQSKSQLAAQKSEREAAAASLEKLK
ncbi:MAG: valine--tRNA ligase [Phycisphaeraceae bacterium]|nr:MAG: valine--tRNA ligase [Phycisphaeraceae bacterium]